MVVGCLLGPVVGRVRLGVGTQGGNLHDAADTGLPAGIEQGNRPVLMDPAERGARPLAKNPDRVDDGIDPGQPR